MYDREAPPGQYRVVGVDLFEGIDYVLKDCKRLTDAKHLADMNAGVMYITHVFDDDGQQV